MGCERSATHNISVPQLVDVNMEMNIFNATLRFEQAVSLVGQVQYIYHFNFNFDKQTIISHISDINNHIYVIQLCNFENQPLFIPVLVEQGKMAIVSTQDLRVEIGHTYLFRLVSRSKLQPIHTAQVIDETQSLKESALIISHGLGFLLLKTAIPILIRQINTVQKQNLHIILNFHATPGLKLLQMISDFQESLNLEKSQLSINIDGAWESKKQLIAQNRPRTVNSQNSDESDLFIDDLQDQKIQKENISYKVTYGGIEEQFVGNYGHVISVGPAWLLRIQQLFATAQTNEGVQFLTGYGDIRQVYTTLNLSNVRVPQDLDPMERSFSAFRYGRDSPEPRPPALRVMPRVVKQSCCGVPHVAPSQDITLGVSGLRYTGSIAVRGH